MKLPPRKDNLHMNTASKNVLLPLHIHLILFTSQIQSQAPCSIFYGFYVCIFNAVDDKCWNAKE